MSPRRIAAQALGAVAIAALLVVVPADVFRAARDVLLVTAAVILLWVALAVFLVPLRNALAATFALTLPRAEGIFGTPADADLRRTFAPLAVPFIVLAILAVATLLR